ncbi:family 43 glycosylhydrolase [Salinimicrobium marinum]|nr:family 43 glycosylhydrolase [Salinimicrobium marinum]
MQIQNPVLPGDFADPSVVRTGNEYWATATSSEWAPLFPLLHSTDLENWEIVDHVFPEGLPEWAEAHFWAPEIAYDNNKYYIYYTAKKKEGPLCVGVASSDNPEGPYEDHGPIICQEAGAIDGFQIRDDEGKLFLIWKEDGNSRGEPTPMWGQQMNEERTELIGDRFELFRNDPETWEGNLVEGAYLLKKNGFYYTFYSGDACCGRECTYGIGVARARTLQGPWEKYENNPLKRENDQWKCAGHGSMVQDEAGRYFFLYHAYRKDGSVYTGRQGMLAEVTWKEDGWPEFKETNTVTGTRKDNKKWNFEDNFETEELSKTWQWPVGNPPTYELSRESLILESKTENLGAVLAQRTLSPDYEAITSIEIKENLLGEHGMAAIGDQNNALGISYSGGKVVVWKIEQNKRTEVTQVKAPEVNEIFFKMGVEDGENYSFFWSEDGKQWHVLGEGASVNGFYLPPWDRAVRIGLVSKGEPGTEIAFNSFTIEMKND